MKKSIREGQLLLPKCEVRFGSFYIISSYTIVANYLNALESFHKTAK